MYSSRKLGGLRIHSLIPTEKWWCWWLRMRRQRSWWLQLQVHPSAGCIREKKIDTFDDFANVYTNLHIRLTHPALMSCTIPIRKRNKMWDIMVDGQWRDNKLKHMKCTSLKNLGSRTDIEIVGHKQPKIDEMRCVQGLYMCDAHHQISSQCENSIKRGKWISMLISHFLHYTTKPKHTFIKK